MSWNVKRSWRWMVGILLAGVLLALTPGAALADGGSARVVLYEVIESPPPRPASGGMPGAFIPGPDGSVTRLAQATLTGPVTEADGSMESWRGGKIGGHVQSQVNLTTGTGPISGFFTVDKVSGSLTAANLSGTIDLSGLLSTTNPIPLAPVSASWGTLGPPPSFLSGTFQGVAQVPFQCGTTACYLNPDGTITPLQPHEFNRDGVPLVRFVLRMQAN